MKLSSSFNICLISRHSKSMGFFPIQTKNITRRTYRRLHSKAAYATITESMNMNNKWNETKWNNVWNNLKSDTDVYSIAYDDDDDGTAVKRNRMQKPSSQKAMENQPLHSWIWLLNVISSISCVSFLLNFFFSHFFFRVFLI